MSSNGSSSGDEELSPVTRAFDDYLDVVMEGDEPDLGKLSALLAEEQRAELERRIRNHELQRELQKVERQREPVQLGRFTILGRVQYGGMSKVYLAHDPKLKRKVALKVIDTSLDVDNQDQQWILNEARSLARIEHPNVVRIFEVDKADGKDFVVMEYLGGPSLDKVIDELRRLRESSTPAAGGEETRTEAAELARKLESIPSRVEVLLQITRALAFCHDLGILHRDIKPGNVRFDDKGRPVLIDFGLAHLGDKEEDTRLQITGKFYATPGYTAPEQIESSQTGADPLSDQFSLGVLAYELLALKNPFHRGSRTKTEQAIIYTDPQQPSRFNPALSKTHDRVLLHTLERAAEDRYPDVHAFAADLEAILEHRAISVEEATLTRMVRLWVRRHRREVTLASIGSFLFVAFMLGDRLLGLNEEQGELLDQARTLTERGDVTGTQYRRTAEELRDVMNRVTEFDASFIRSSLIGEVRPAVLDGIQGWGERLHAKVRAEIARCEGDLLSMQYLDWQEALAIESRIISCTVEDGLHERGAIQIEGVEPERVQLFEQTASKEYAGYNTYQLIETRFQLVPGFYRIRILSPKLDHVQREIGLVVTEAWAPVVRLESEALWHPLYAKSMWVEGVTWTLPGDVLLSLPGFKVTNLVTVGECLSIFEEAGQEPPKELLDRPVDWPAPSIGAVTDLVLHHTGGRFPTVYEIEAALRSGTTQRHPRVGGEETCERPYSGNGALHLAYTDLEEYLDDPPADSSRIQSTHMGPHQQKEGVSYRTGAEKKPLGFRLVFPGGSLDMQIVTKAK